MELTTIERLVLPSVLPREEHVVTLKIVRELKDRIGFSAEEVDAIKLRPGEDGGMDWEDVLPPKEIELSEAEITIIAKQLRELEEAGKLHEDQLSLYEKFVES